MSQEDVFKWIDIYGLAGEIIMLIAAIVAGYQFLKALSLIVYPPSEMMMGREEIPKKQVAMRLISFIFLSNMVLFLFGAQNTFHMDTTGVESTLAINEQLLGMVNEANSERYSQAHWMDSLTIITVLGFIMTVGAYGIYEGGAMLGRLGEPGAESMGYSKKGAFGRMVGGFLCWNALDIARLASIVE